MLHVLTYTYKKIRGLSLIMEAIRGYISPGNSEMAAHAAPAPAGILKVTSCF